MDEVRMDKEINYHSIDDIHHLKVSNVKSTTNPALKTNTVSLNAQVIDCYTFKTLKNKLAFSLTLLDRSNKCIQLTKEYIKVFYERLLKIEKSQPENVNNTLMTMVEYENPKNVIDICFFGEQAKQYSKSVRPGDVLCIKNAIVKDKLKASMFPNEKQLWFSYESRLEKQNSEFIKPLKQKPIKQLCYYYVHSFDYLYNERQDFKHHETSGSSNFSPGKVVSLMGWCENCEKQLQTYDQDQSTQKYSFKTEFTNGISIVDVKVSSKSRILIDDALLACSDSTKNVLVIQNAYYLLKPGIIVVNLDQHFCYFSKAAQLNKALKFVSSRLEKKRNSLPMLGSKDVSSLRFITGAPKRSFQHEYSKYSSLKRACARFSAVSNRKTSSELQDGGSQPSSVLYAEFPCNIHIPFEFLKTSLTCSEPYCNNEVVFDPIDPQQLFSWKCYNGKQFYETYKSQHPLEGSEIYEISSGEPLESHQSTTNSSPTSVVITKKHSIMLKSFVHKTSPSYNFNAFIFLYDKDKLIDDKLSDEPSIPPSFTEEVHSLEDSKSEEEMPTKYKLSCIKKAKISNRLITTLLGIKACEWINLTVEKQKAHLLSLTAHSKPCVAKVQFKTRSTFGKYDLVIHELCFDE